MEIEKIYIDHRSKQTKDKVSPTVYTISFSNGQRCHLYSKWGNKGVKTHISKLKSSTHDNKRLQELFNNGHVPEFKFYITASHDAAKDLEWKLVKDDIENPMLLNEVLDTRSSFLHTSKQCIIDGVKYHSIHEASRITGHSRELIRKMTGL